ncbi:MAG: thioredoxin [Ferrimicrobium sp.]|jgi:thioredoxin 1|uniref:Thioredoxin n=1 Tax=Ferrimicrobium acidiphilum TaxID=121039 RepID=A0ABV3XZY7_9ACTN|nr:thioredoxin [Ferrimicrobium sp.]MCL5973172.1 thioredoxin [Actinomycetota bacterium]
MATKNLTAADFNETVEGHGIVLVDFWAAWCGPCRAFAPVYEELSEEHPEIVFGKVDTEAERELAQAFQIMSIPTLMAFRDQILLYAQPGALPRQALAEIIAQVEALDMDEVRRQIAEQETTAAQQ